MDSQVAFDFTLGYIAFFIGIGVTLLLRRLAPRKAPTSVVSADSQDQQDTAEPSPSTVAIREIRDVALNMTCDISAHRALVESVSARLGASLTAETRDEELILGATVELLDANFDLQTQLAEAEQKISAQQQELTCRQRDAETDPLSGLPNRRAFDARLEDSIHRLAAAHEPFSLIMLDVDYFKQFNDAHGHVAGDEVLRALGRKLPQIVKDHDVGCRYGGEEFAVILRGARLLEAQAAALRIRAAIELMGVELEGCTLSVTASFGVAEASPGEDARKLIARADDGVYASKRAGRNCVHWHNGSHCVLAQEPKRQAAARDRTPRPAGSEQAPHNLHVPFIADRAVLMSLLQRRVAESARSGEPLSVIQFNTSPPGDGSRRAASSPPAMVEACILPVIASSLRDMDYIGRWSDTEFTAILPRCTQPGGRIVAQRLLAAAKSAISADEQLEGALVTVGLATIDHPMSADQLIAEARNNFADAMTLA